MFKLGYIASSIRRAIGKLLDLYPNAAAAYSLRQLRTDYSGSAVRVRRSIDNTEQDVGFDGIGNLDESALTTFVGNGNIFTYSEQFDNAAWSKTNITVTSNQTTAPDGTVTADLIAETAINGTKTLSQSLPLFISGRQYTQSIYFKKGTGATAPDIIQLTFRDTAFGASQYANFNISTGVVTAQVGGTATINSAANGFYRCTFTATATATSGGSSSILSFVNNNPLATRQPGYLGLITSDIFAWGAQLNAGSTAQPYVQTVANQAGFGYVTKWYDQSGTPLNLVTYSEQFQQSAWGKTNTTVTADQTTAPDGTVSADLIAETISNGFHVVSTTISPSYVSGISYTQSVYFKKGSGVTAPDIIQLSFQQNQFGTGQYANFNINTGVVTSSTGGTATITSVGSGWYRCSWTAICTVTGTGNTSAGIIFVNNNPSSTRNPSYVGLTTSNVFAWGAQLVQGSLPLTYVKTEASNSNRDVVQTTAANQPAIVTAGQIERQGTKATLYFDGTNDRLDTGGVVISQPDTSIVVARQLAFTANKIVIDGVTTRQYISSSASNFITMNAGTDLASSTAWGTTYRLIFALFNSSSSTISQNNSSIATGNSGTNVLSGLRVGASSTSTLFWNGWQSEIVLYPSNQTANQSGIQTDINTYYTIY